MHLYLLSIKENRKSSIYPDYIYDGTDREIKNYKKYFRNLCLNHELNNYNELNVKRLKKKNIEKIKIKGLTDIKKGER